MTDPSPVPVNLLHRTAVARWRRMFVLYAIVLTTATHWPALELGTEAVPAADKILHLFAFAVLTALLWRTAWVRSLLLLVVVGLMWAALDEWSQSIPLLERQFSSLDVVSSALGVLLACAWLAALRPRGGPANRARLALGQCAIDMLFGGPMRSMTLGAWLLVAAILAQIGFGLVFALPRVISLLPALAPALGYGAMQALCIGIFIVVFDRLARWTMEAAVSGRLCPWCGAADACGGYDESGFVSCRNCGTSLHRGTWLPNPSPDAVRLRRFMHGPAALAICILGAGAGVFIGAVALFRRAMDSGEYATTALRAARGLHELPDDFVLAVDMSLLGFALAVMVWMYRRNLARWHDRQHLECRRCGYDLHATLVTQGIGACPECGASFARY